MRKLVDSHKHFFVSVLCILASLFVWKIAYEQTEHRAVGNQVYTGERLGK